MRSSYSEEDVILLLKDITGLVEPQPAKVREKLIQSGKHYSEMLPVEYVPTDQYMQVYHNALKHYAKPVANAVGMLADKIIENKGKENCPGIPCQSGNPNWYPCEAIHQIQIWYKCAALFHFNYQRKRD